MPKGPHQEKPGRLPKLTVDRVKAALENTGGIKSAAAVQLGVGRTTLYSFINANPELAHTINEIDDTVMDMAEGQIVKAIKSGDLQTCRWYAEMKGKDRGYSRHSTVGGKGGKPIQVEAATIDTAGLSTAALKEIRAAAVVSHEPD